MNSMEQFVEHLLSAIPEVQNIYKAHIDDNGALLPHVFMGDITRFVLQASRSDMNRDVLRRVFSLVEEGLISNEPEISNLVAVSFIENLCGEDETVATILPLIGDATRKELRSICGY